MRKTAHQHGCSDALAYYGCAKVASTVDWSAVRNYLKPDFKTWPGRAKQFMLGDPKKFYTQLKNNGLFAEDGMLRNVFKTAPLNTKGGLAQAAMLYGMPLYGLYQSAQAPAEARGSAVGSMIGSTLGGFAGTPLGMVGQMGGGVLGGQFGHALGSGFNAKAPLRPLLPPVAEAPPMPHRVDEGTPISEQMAQITGRPVQW